MATILVIILRVNRPNFVHFCTVNAQKRSPNKGQAAAWSAYSWIRACNFVTACASGSAVVCVTNCRIIISSLVDLELLLLFL